MEECVQQGWALWDRKAYQECARISTLGLMAGLAIPPCPAPLASLSYLAGLALWYAGGTPLDQSEILFRQTLAWLETDPDRWAEDLLTCRQSLSHLLEAAQRWEDSEALLMQILTNARHQSLKFHTDIGDISADLLRLRIARLAATEGLTVYGWARRNTSASPGSVDLPSAMICAASTFLPDPAAAEDLLAEAGILLATAGRCEDALDLAAPFLLRSHWVWSPARIHAACIAYHLGQNDPRRAIQATRNALTQARQATVVLGGDNRGPYDLLDALSWVHGALPLILPMLPPQEIGTATAFMVERLTDQNNLDEAIAVLEAAPPLDPDDASVLSDLAELAVRLGRSDAVVRLTPRMMNDPDSRHRAIEALFMVGAEEEALTALAQLLPAPEYAPLVEALSMAARYFGEHGNRQQFEHFSASCLHHGQINIVPGFSQCLRRLAEGALSLMTVEDTTIWAEATVPAPFLSSFREMLVVALRNLNRLPEARSRAALLPEPERERRLRDLDLFEKNCQSISAAQINDDWIMTGQWDQALDHIRILPDHLAATDGLIRLADAAGRAKNMEIVSRALTAALMVLPGPFIDPPAAVFARNSLRYAAGKRLGQAVARLLPAQDAASFAQAALARAESIPDIATATPAVIAAGYAALSPDQPISGLASPE